LANVPQAFKWAYDALRVREKLGFGPFEAGEANADREFVELTGLGEDARDSNAYIVCSRLARSGADSRRYMIDGKNCTSTALSRGTME
jgi:hypothetical protein